MDAEQDAAALKAFVNIPLPQTGVIDEAEAVRFQFKGEHRWVRLVAGKFEVEYRFEDQPFVATREVWNRQLKNLDLFEELRNE